MRSHRFLLAALLAAAGACLPAPAPAPLAPPPPPPPPPPMRFAAVWTEGPDVQIRGDSSLHRLPYAFTRLDVLAADSAALLVRCGVCVPVVSGSVAREDVLYQPLPPRVAARGTLAEFALAVRAAALVGDTAALRPVMGRDFTFAFVGEQGVEEAFAAWASTGLSELAQVPALLDRGLASSDTSLWAAPPEHFATLGYSGPRLGFRRTDGGGWEWVFFVRGVLER